MGAVLVELIAVSHHWYNIGFLLKVPVSTLENIKAQPGNDAEHFREVLIRWLMMTTPLPTWVALVETLRNPRIGDWLLASHIEARHCPWRRSPALPGRYLASHFVGYSVLIYGVVSILQVTRDKDSRTS